MRKVCQCLLALLLASFTATARPQDDAPVIRICSGPIRGVRRQGIVAYKGIPYAAPPVGGLRWKPPQPPQPWKDIRLMDAFGPVCPQKKQKLLPIDFGAMDEDCLYLNVWTPAEPSAEPLPVMVWFHGGGFVMGAGSAKQYDGHSLANKRIVVVTLNYRLGRFGFFALPELSAESPQHVSGNYGLLDQIFALKWVQKNIHSFGGNPNNVTIFGESAGGASVCALMTSPLAKGLFHRAIAQSSYASPKLPHLKESSLGLKSAYQLGAAFAKKLGVQRGSGVVERLRKKPWQKILAADDSQIVLPGSTMAACLCIDGYALKDAPGNVFQAGGQARVPLIIGVNRDEGALFSRQFKDYALFTFNALLRRIGVEDAAQVRRLYHVKDNETAANGLAQFMGDWFNAGCRRTARAHAAAGNPVYMYRFTRTLPWASRLGLGSFHGFEITYVFGTNPGPLKGYRPADRDISEKMQAYWACFAKTGDPNHDAAVRWPRYSAQAEEYLVIDTQLSADRALRPKYCDFVDSLVKMHKDTRRPQ